MSAPSTNGTLPKQMNLGFNERCKVCSSGLRVEVEKRHVEGNSARSIAKWLIEQTGDQAYRHSHVSSHIKNHFNVREETAKRYADAIASQELIKDVAEERLTDIQMLDEISKQDFAVRKMTTRWISDLMTVTKEDGKPVIPRLPLPLITLHNAAASEIRQNRKTKAELLGEDPNGSSVDLASVLEDAWLRRHSASKEDDTE